MKRIYYLLFILVFLTSCHNVSKNEEQRIDVAKVVSDFPVGFSLVTHGDMQFVAYYDTEHRLTVASRKLNEKEWIYKVLDTSVGWDSHNYITMKIDTLDSLPNQIEKDVSTSGVPPCFPSFPKSLLRPPFLFGAVYQLRLKLSVASRRVFAVSVLRRSQVISFV